MYDNKTVTALLVANQHNDQHSFQMSYQEAIVITLISSHHVHWMAVIRMAGFSCTQSTKVHLQNGHVFSRFTHKQRV